MFNHALSTYTCDSENRVAPGDVELSGGFAGAEEVEGGGDRGGLGMGAQVYLCAKSFAHILYAERYNVLSRSLHNLHERIPQTGQRT